MLNNMNAPNITADGILSYNPHELEGHIIPRSFHAGFVILSYFVSFIGALTTLELIHCRTATKGLYNWFLLAASSLTMGGIAVWSMHFIGNRAVILGNGDPAFQILYSSRYTVISFFLPVAVVFVAFGTTGAVNDNLSIVRLTLGGSLAGLGICGMHYLGQAGISNYDCIYNSICVVGAVVIAILASVGALVIFFVYRNSWNTAWWKRACCGLLLAAAVSGMHWVASIGTYYRLRAIDPDVPVVLSRSLLVVIVVILSVVACFILLFFLFLAQRRIFTLARRARQVVLAIAVFDMDGRILVSAQGTLPTKKITDVWIEQSLNDAFNVSHPVFLWMFRTSRHWRGIAHLIPAMRSHIHQMGLKGILKSKDDKLINDEGSPIENYSLVFRELFCVAAAELAASLHQPLEKIGILFDDMMITGKLSEEKNFNSKKSRGRARKSAATGTSSMDDLEMDSLGGQSGQGQLLYLVSRVGRRDAETFEAAGYRFANIPQVVNILANSFQVKPSHLGRRLEIMREYATELHMLDHGVHFACFAIRASLGAGRHGFDVLARRDAKNLLPTMQISPDPLEDWQLDYIKQMDTFPLAVCMKNINKDSKPSNPLAREREFAKLLLTALETFKAEIEDPFINDALLIGRPVLAPCRGETPDSTPGTAQLLCFTIIVPVHGRAPGKKLMFEPLNFFNMQQHVYPQSPDHKAFARKTHGEYKSILNLGAAGVSEGGSFSTLLNTVSLPPKISFSKRNQPEQITEEYGEELLIPRPAVRKIRFWDRSARVKIPELESSPSPGNSPSSNFLEPGAAVMISDKGMAKKTTAEEEADQKTYVDELFTLTIQKKSAVR